MNISDVIQDFKKSLFKKKSDDFLLDDSFSPVHSTAEDTTESISDRQDAERISLMELDCEDNSSEGFMQKMDNLPMSKKLIVALVLAGVVAGTVYGVKTQTATGQYTLNLSVLKQIPVIGQYLPIPQSHPPITAQNYSDLSKPKNTQNPPVVVTPPKQQDHPAQSGDNNKPISKSLQQGTPAAAKGQQPPTQPPGTPNPQQNNQVKQTPDAAAGQLQTAVQPQKNNIPQSAQPQIGKPQPQPVDTKLAAAAAPKASGIFPVNPFMEYSEWDAGVPMGMGTPGPGQTHLPGAPGAKPPTANVPPVPTPAMPGGAHGKAPTPSSNNPMEIMGVTRGASGNNIAIMGDGKILEVGDNLGSGEIAYIGGDGITLDNGTEISFDAVSNSKK